MRLPVAQRVLNGPTVRKPLSPALIACLGGLGATSLDIVALAALIQSGTPVAVAAFLGSAVGAVACFLANKRFAFRDRTPLSMKQVGAFGLVSVGTALLMAAAMQLTVVQMGIPYLLAKVLCASAAFFVWSYPAQKRFVFRRFAKLDDPSASMA